MKTPNFWYKQKSIGKYLEPLGFIYGAVTAYKIRYSRPTSVKIPVISVGNLTVGGTGKTPIAISLAQILKEKGEVPAVILRGYGGRLHGPIKVDGKIHSALDVGDEAILHAKHGRTWIARKRSQAAVQAEKNGATVIILDDGHQHSSLKKDFSILIVDGEKGFGNKKIIPAGPLREHINTGLKRADKIVIMREITNKSAKALAERHHILKANLKIVDNNISLAGTRVVAFAGIGQPDYFFETLNNAGAELIETYSFADHHKYSSTQIEDIKDRACVLNAITVTTEKDATKIDLAQHSNICVLKTEVEWENISEIRQLMKKIMTRG
ncbi:MAG: tetraacyldisaccharide 4'-kinase [Rhodospirillaceae bacterium]|nr:tetraacyldisaccharide 4'-kinase [Rhodospirillaceae bacterium]